MNAPIPTAVRAFAALPTGVHAISREQATEMIVSPVRRTQGDGAAEPPPLVWLDISNPGQDEAAFLRDAIGFHPLTVEDCLRGRQRPKLERYPGYFFLVMYAAGINVDRDRMALNEMHIFLGAHYVVTVHDDRVREVTEIVARWRTQPAHYKDVGALAHSLVDLLVDDYFPVLEHLGDRVEELEGSVFNGRDGRDSIPKILRLRREITALRRVVVPERELLGTLLRRDLPFLRPELLPYFQDVHDHVIRITEEIDALRDLLSAALDAQMSASSNELNNTMRTLTSWSIILMSVTLIAGIYGMNFANMPELGWHWGYYGALGAMVLLGVGLAMFFQRRHWL